MAVKVQVPRCYEHRLNCLVRQPLEVIFNSDCFCPFSAVNESGEVKPRSLRFTWCQCYKASFFINHVTNKWARVFVPKKPQRTSSKFASEAGAFRRLSTRLYYQTLDLTVQACQGPNLPGKHPSFLARSVCNSDESVITCAPGAWRPHLREIRTKSWQKLRK